MSNKGLIRKQNRRKTFGIDRDVVKTELLKDCSSTNRDSEEMEKLQESRSKPKEEKRNFFLNGVGKEIQTSHDKDFRVKDKKTYKETKAEHLHKGKIKLFALRNLSLKRGKSLDTFKDGLQRTKDLKDFKTLNCKSLEAADEVDDCMAGLKEEDYIVHHQESRRPAICEEIERIVETNNGTPLRTQRRNLIVSDNLFKWHLL